MSRSFLERLRGLSAALGLISAVSVASALELHKEKNSAFDLAVRGRLEGVPAGETRYLRWAEVRALPSRTLRVVGEFVPGEQEVTIVMLDQLLEKLPRAEGADLVIATCTDGYASIYTSAFRERYKPFLVLEINGRGPEVWPPQGLTFNPGPYVISTAEQVAPGVSTMLDAGHKRPWGVNTIEISDPAERLAPFRAGPLAAASGLTAEGRELWLNSCFSCHNLPEVSLGGTKAARPLQIVATHAVYNAAYFRDYVRTPTKLNPVAKMEPHPHYTDAQLDALIAFLKAKLGPAAP